MKFLVIEEANNKLLQVYEVETDSYLDLVETIEENEMSNVSKEIVLTEEEGRKLLEALKDIYKLNGGV